MIVEVVIVIVAAAAVVGLVVGAVLVHDARIRQPRGPNPTRPRKPNPTPLAGARDVIDRSIAMYVLRRLVGRRSSAQPDPGRGAPSGVAHRMAAAGTARAVTSFYVADPPRSNGRAATGVPIPSGASRERLVRDTGIALVALTVLGLTLVTLWPRGPSGRPGGDPGVVRASQTPWPSATSSANVASTPGASPSGVVLSETSAPTRAPTVAPTRTRRPSGTPKPTPSPTASPTPIATPEVTPSPEPSQTPAPTPDSTPPGPTPSPSGPSPS